MKKLIREMEKLNEENGINEKKDWKNKKYKDLKLDGYVGPFVGYYFRDYAMCDITRGSNDARILGGSVSYKRYNITLEKSGNFTFRRGQKLLKSYKLGDNNKELSWICLKNIKPPTILPPVNQLSHIISINSLSHSLPPSFPLTYFEIIFFNNQLHFLNTKFKILLNNQFQILNYPF